MWRSALLCSLLGALLLAVPSSSVAVMSVDLGSEWMKVAVVTPGVPMEIALNRESKRKTAMAVSLRGDERTFGSDALSNGVRYPKTCYAFLLDLLGKPFAHPQVKRYQERFPYYELKAHPDRGTVVFKHDEDTAYSVEELVAMILEHAREIGEDYTEQKIKDVVLTVPVYFGQAERRALLDAAELAGLNVLQLISEPMAVALNYGMFRRKEVNGTAKHLMFYDMGSQDTTVSIVSFQTVKTKERGFSETHPHAHILGIGYERNLGGADLQVALREYLADQFNALKKTKTDVRSVPRAMGKLFKEAARVKTVLSANANTYAQVENVMEDIDFRMEVTRDKLMELSGDYFERVTRPVEAALASAAMTMGEIGEVILVGAGTRVPRVQEILKEHVGRELGKNLNTDESAAMGAVYKAADLSTGFKVKKFVTKEGVVFPIDVDFAREYENDDGETGTKEVKRSLFSRMNLYPQKKIMTFNKHVGDFTFRANLNELDHLGDEVSNIGSLNLTEVDVKGVAAALDKYAEVPNVESKGVKAHFSLDDSGLLSVTAVESVFEKTITVEEQEEEERKKEGEKKKTEEAAKGDGDKKEEGDDKKDGSWAESIASFFNKDEEGKEDEKKDGKKGKDKGKDKKKDDKKKEEKKKEEEPKKKEFKPKIETLKEPLEFEVRIVDMPRLTEKHIKESKEKLKALNDRDELKKKKETALNSLESFVIDVRDKMYQETYEDSLTETEKESISTKCSEISDWIDEEVTPETEVKDLEERLKALKELTSGWFARVREHIDRPEALGALDQMLNTSSNFLAKARNKTGDDGYFSVAEVDKLAEKLEEVQKWREEALAEQEKQPKNEMPKMTTSLIAEKALDLDREVKYLLNKAKIAKAEQEKERLKKEAEEKAAKEKEEKEKKKKKKKEENATEEETSKETPDSQDAKEEEIDETSPNSENEDQSSKTEEETQTPEAAEDDDAAATEKEAQEEEAREADEKDGASDSDDETDVPEVEIPEAADSGDEEQQSEEAAKDGEEEEATHTEL